MRSLLLAIALLLTGGWAASQWPVTAAAQTPDSLRWVRTVDGWERSATLLPPEKKQQQRLHPSIIVALQVLGSGLALAAGWKE